jgi:hypothetical protein
MKISWKFPRNDGGRETGFSDAGVETFKGNTDKYLAREVLQNSLDARYDPNKPVRVVFRVMKLKRSDIPDFDSLRVTFSRCAEFFHDEKKAVDFFRRAEKLATADEIQALEVGDYNTTGVRGADLDRTKEWYKLIRCAGSSSKGGGEGGSFGIGKNAPFAASQLRTVLYSTRTIDAEHAFQGVATLVSHNHPGGGIAQPTGFLGAENGLSVRTPSDIPKLFRRSECGIDITILGFAPGPSWVDDLTYSVLDNFWPAIEFGDIEVTVGDREISKATLPGLLERFASAEDFTAHLYYRAFMNPTMLPIKEDLPILGECTVYLLSGPAEVMPKKVAMIRKTGMKIYEKAFRAIVPFCGVFICRNDQGNRVLREMEPPKHDIWDPDHPEKGAHKRTYSELVNFIRSCIKSFLPADDSRAIAVPGLQRYLPDDDETPEESFDEAGPEQTAESFRRQLTPGKVEGRSIESRRSMRPDEAAPEQHGDETEEPGEGEGTGGGPSAGSDREWRRHRRRGRRKRRWRRQGNSRRRWRRLFEAFCPDPLSDVPDELWSRCLQSSGSAREASCVGQAESSALGGRRRPQRLCGSSVREARGRDRASCRPQWRHWTDRGARGRRRQTRGGSAPSASRCHGGCGL